MSQDADDDEVKRAYRKAALKTHPDKVGNAVAHVVMGGAQLAVVIGWRRLLLKQVLVQNAARSRPWCSTCGALAFELAATATRTVLYTRTATLLAGY